MMIITRIAETVVILLLMPSICFAHGEQVIAFPVSGLIAIILGIGFIAVLREKFRFKIMLFCLLICVIAATWFIVAYSMDNGSIDIANFMDHLELCVILMAAFPLAICSLVVLFTRSGNKSVQ
jgi:hypothetical protein